ncbi:hypothetical protein HMPREF2746_17470 [Pseudomonas aeruginosa]|nr:hypothetical protein HMPREF2746_17470 [Pseudomonas aeruginosa]
MSKGCGALCDLDQTPACGGGDNAAIGRHGIGIGSSYSRLLAGLLFGFAFGLSRCLFTRLVCCDRLNTCFGGGQRIHADLETTDRFGEEFYVISCRETFHFPVEEAHIGFRSVNIAFSHRLFTDLFRRTGKEILCTQAGNLLLIQQ